MNRALHYHMQDSCHIQPELVVEVPESSLWLWVTLIFAAGFIIGLVVGIEAMS